MCEDGEGLAVLLWEKLDSKNSEGVDSHRARHDGKKVEVKRNNEAPTASLNRNKTITQKCLVTSELHVWLNKEFTAQFINAFTM